MGSGWERREPRLILSQTKTILERKRNVLLIEKKVESGYIEENSALT
jgi:hypothetical protein